MVEDVVAVPQERVPRGRLQSSLRDLAQGKEEQRQRDERAEIDPAAGGLGAVTASFADYASDVVASVASKASQATSDYNNKQTTQSAFANTMSSESGVNLDEETAKLSSLQNEYTAAAELLQVINQMFSALMGAVQTAVA